jgi:flagellar biosynthesis/type III secretory pathway M-ring protein FliF/YscJ
MATSEGRTLVFQRSDAPRRAWRTGRAGTPAVVETLALVAFIVMIVVVALVLVWVVMRFREREREKDLQRSKLASVAQGHREMAEAHAGSLEGLREQALEHRQAAVDHTRKAEAVEGRIEQKERQAAFHEDRALETQHEREQV